MSYKLHSFETPFEAAKAFANDFKDIIEKNISEKGEVNISISGGNTPKILFDIIASEYADKIDWSKVNFFWVDERCVPPEDNESNYGMTKKHLFNFINIPEGNIHRIKGEDNPEKEVFRYAEEIKSKIKNMDDGRIPIFDLMILGIGDDGHTASIFPNNIHLWNSENICEIAEHPVSGQKRITLTGNIINNSKKIVFLITGKNKAAVFNKILNKKEGYLNFPSALVEPVSGELYFYVDKDALEF